MTNSLPGVRGAQRPRYDLVPTAAYTEVGDKAVALSAAAGLVLDPWQEHVVRGMLGERFDYKFAAPEVGIVVPRQQGKGSIIEARELAGLFLLGEKLILHTAHELKTSQAAFERVRGLIDNTPDLSKHVQQMYTGNTENSIVLKNGSKLKFLARTAGSGRGLTADLLILDEAYALQAQHMAALLPTVTTSKNPQTVYTSSAGMPNSEVLAALRERGMNPKSRNLAYFEWSADDDADADDMEALIQANPGLGIRLTLDHVATEREALDDETFKRERLGIWAKIGGDSAIPARWWGACLDHDSVAAAGVAFAVDVPPSRDLATIAAVSERPDGVRHVEIVDRREGTAWVAERLKELQDRWSPLAIVLDEGSAAGALAPDVKRAGVRTRPIGMKDYGQACAAVYDAVRQGNLAHTGQGELDAAVEASQTKTMGDSLWKWDRRNVVSDVSPLIAVTLAWYGVTVKARRVAAQGSGSGWKVGSLG